MNPHRAECLVLREQDVQDLRADLLLAPFGFQKLHAERPSVEPVIQHFVLADGGGIVRLTGVDRLAERDLGDGLVLLDEHRSGAPVNVEVGHCLCGKVLHPGSVFLGVIVLVLSAPRRRAGIETARRAKRGKRRDGREGKEKRQNPFFHHDFLLIQVTFIKDEQRCIKNDFIQ